MYISKDTKDYLKKDHEIFAKVQHIADLPFVIKKAWGFSIYDLDDKAYLDFTSAACTMNLGYTRAQIPDTTSFPFPYAYSKAQVDYGSLLLDKYSFYDDKLMMFCVTGSDANDGAIKFSRAFTGKKQIVAFRGNYHGTTFGAASLTSLEGRLDNHLGPMLPNVTVLPFCKEGSDDIFIEKCINDFLSLNINDIAAVFLEVIQGDTGMIPISHVFLHKLYAICKENNILIVSDEVQMSFYRTSKFFSIENYKGIKPDLITMGKHLGGGIPLGAIIGRSDVMQSLNPCEHAFSMCGNNEACLRGLENFKIIETPLFLDNLKKNIAYLSDALEALSNKYPTLIEKTCGIGLARSIFIKSQFDDDTDNEACYKIITRCFEKGLYLMRIGSNWLRIEPFLNIPQELLQQGLTIIDESLNDYMSQKIDGSVKKYMS